MLIYVNQFELVGDDSFKTACRTITGWLKNVTKRHFSVSELLSGDEFSIDKIKVRTYKAAEYSPELYSILLSHPDRQVKGRQWITEIGIKVEGEYTTVSILLETSEISSLVREHPKTTRPKLVTFLQRNGNLSSKTVGLNVQTINNAHQQFKALDYEIHRHERSYPIVFVSNCKTAKKPLVDPEILQNQLLGLAQVVTEVEEINSWELEDVLTRQYSAWDGAINILYPSLGRDFCPSKLFRKEHINELLKEKINISQHILSYITHTTNGYNKKVHFSPSDVRAKRQKDLRTKLKIRFDELSNDGEYQNLAEEAFQQLEEQDAVTSQLKDKHQKEIEEQLIALMEVQEELDKVKSEHQVLKLRFDDLQNHSTKKGEAVITFGVENEKYKGEISDLAFDALKAYSESTARNSRKQQLLEDMLKNNSLDGTRDRYIQELKIIFNNYNGMTPKIRSSLKALGLEVIEEGNHNHLRFFNDERYQVAFAKTPSDRRIGANLVRDIKSQLL